MNKVIYQTNEIKDNIGYLNSQLRWYDLYNILGDDRDNYLTQTIENYFDTNDHSLLRSGGYLRMYSSKNRTKNTEKKFFVEYKKDEMSTPIKLPLTELDDISRHTKVLGIKEPVHFVLRVMSKNHFFPVQYVDNALIFTNEGVHFNFVIEDVQIYASESHFKDKQIRFLSLRDMTEKKNGQTPSKLIKDKIDESFHLFKLIMGNEGYSQVNQTRYQLLMNMAKPTFQPKTEEKENKKWTQ